MFHEELKKNGWNKLSFLEQLGNIGSEIGRTAKNQGKDENAFFAAAQRALELFDMTLSDSRWKGRLLEIARAREVFCDAVWNGGSAYKSKLNELDRYFFRFAYAARLKQGV